MEIKRDGSQLYTLANIKYQHKQSSQVGEIHKEKQLLLNHAEKSTDMKIF